MRGYQAISTAGERWTSDDEGVVEAEAAILFMSTDWHRETIESAISALLIWHHGGGRWDQTDLRHSLCSSPLKKTSLGGKSLSSPPRMGLAFKS
jgi:hypothetical protein